MTEYYFPILKQSDIFTPNGKIEVLDPTTTNKIDVFTYNSTSDTYVVATNPIYLTGSGSPEHTYFVKQLAYLRLYKYIGNFSNPRQDDDTENWKLEKQWFNSIDLDKITSENLDVYGLYGLMEADTSLGTVDVVGYWTANDCEKRTYIWDENCVAEPDNGYVVASNDSEVGRWILKFDGEFLPSTYYGVYPGHVENINLLVSYDETVGTFSARTAPGVYFVKGYYSDRSTPLITDKKLMMDGDTHFICEIECDSLIVVGDTDENPIADFVFADEKMEAHSSWFRSAKAFYTCGAGKLIFDEHNYFLDRVIPSTIRVQNKVLEGTNTLGVLTYGENAYIEISDCVILGTKLWSSTDYIKFAYMPFKDTWFDISSLGLWDFTNKIICRSFSLNKIELHNFENAEVFILAKRANGDTIIDLEGRVLNSVNLSGFTDIRNVNCNTLSIANEATVDVNMLHVYSSVCYITCKYLTLRDCVMGFGTEPSIMALWAFDSTLESSINWTKNKQLIFFDCDIGISFKRVTDNITQENLLYFERCTFRENIVIESKRLELINSTTHSNYIRIYPYKDDLNTYRMYVKLQGNTFNNAAPIEFTKVETVNGAYYENDCWEIIPNWIITDNSFDGNELGLKCRYWQHRTGANYNKTFIAWSDLATITYFGNKGKCPDDTAKKVTMSNGTGCEANFYWQAYGGDYFTLNKVNPVRIMPKLKNGVIDNHPQSEAINGNGLAVRTKHTGNDGADFQASNLCWIYPWSSLNDTIDDGDFFKMGFSRFGKVTEANPSYYYWTWRFI